MKIKITKIRELENALHPNNIEVGSERIKEMPDELFRRPQVGLPFYAGMFRTSVVQEIIDNNTFKTHNSVYRWEILPTFSVEEFKNYVLSKDSMGDILYFLNAENIRKANEPKEDDE